MPEEEFDSGDDLFDDVVVDDLLQKNSGKRPGESGNLSTSSKKPRLTLNQSADDNVHKTLVDEGARLQVARKILKQKFGYQSFRHEQEGAISRILGGENAVVIFPTGAGKSLCYQIPAIAFEELDRESGSKQTEGSGITIVVSPLIALMKDQVDALKRKGIAAECVDSTKTREELQHINDSLYRGKLRLLYCAPERLNNEGFVESMKRVKGGVRLIGVDEAHCISEWGHSFRPDYLKVARFVQEINAERVICLTATATPLVTEDICKAFSVCEDGVFRTSPYRPNLRLETISTATSQDKFDLLFKLLQNHPGSTLIYVTLQKQAEQLATDLIRKGFPAAFFHAGMKIEEKKSVQDDFMNSRIRTVVATIAFGMGIDKADIRNIVHWDLPSTIEEYCQQVGRAGRDGKPSFCTLYLCREDLFIKENFARGDLPSRRSLQSLVEDIFDEEVRKLSPGETFKASHYGQGSEFDIRSSPLSIIYAALELRFNLIRAVTPEYSAYKFEATPKYLPRLKSRNTEEARAILRHAVKARKYFSINPTAVAQSEGLNRTDLVRLLNELNDTDAIRLTATGVEHKYRILIRPPQKNSELRELADKVYADLQSREKQALGRIKQVVDIMTASKCLARSITEHFGASLPDSKQSCGHCTFCINKKPSTLAPAVHKQVDKSQIQRVLSTTDVRDDPRFLARVAFGMKSPRVTKLKLDKTPVFMSMIGQDFDLVLESFKKACGVEGES